MANIEKNVIHMKRYEIRELVEKDLFKVVEIAKYFRYNSWTKRVFADCLQAEYSGWVVIDKQNDDIRGFIVALFQENECQLMNIGVYPDYWRRGLGKRLLQHLIDHARSHKIARISLEVRASNTSAISLYERNGFMQVGVRKGYYPADQGREDALIFFLNL